MDGGVSLEEHVLLRFNKTVFFVLSIAGHSVCIVAGAT